MRIVIEGRPISKKNSRILLPRKMWSSKKGKMVTRVDSVPSNDYQKFEKDALEQLGIFKAANNPFKVPVYVKYIFHIMGKTAVDGDNLEAGINDILQSAKIIVNDRWVEEWHGKKVFNSTRWYTEVTIVPLEGNEVAQIDELGGVTG